MSEARARGFTVQTRCKTVEEFVDHFHDRTGPGTLFVHTVDARLVGTECGFAVLLANKHPVLAGTCVVLEVYRDANNRFKRPGMQLAVKRLGPESDKVFAALEAARELRAEPDTLVEKVPGTPTPVQPVATKPLPVISRRATEPMRVSTEAGGPVEAIMGRRTERMGSMDL